MNYLKRFILSNSEETRERMNTAVVISLLIVGLSILTLIIVGLISYKKMKPTIHKFNDLNTNIQQKIKFYNREAEHLNHRIININQEVETLQKELLVKSQNFENLLDEQGQFQNSLRYLQNHSSEFSKGIASNLKDEVKDEGPKIMKIFKRAFKKTIQKQKDRHKTN